MQTTNVGKPGHLTTMLQPETGDGGGLICFVLGWQAQTLWRALQGTEHLLHPLVFSLQTIPPNNQSSMPFSTSITSHVSDIALLAMSDSFLQTWLRPEQGNKCGHGCVVRLLLRQLSFSVSSKQPAPRPQPITKTANPLSAQKFKTLKAQRGPHHPLASPTRWFLFPSPGVA